MNIFVLHRNPSIAARMHCDKHVVKMILESTQMLCNVVEREGAWTPYTPVHRNHPCSIWAGKSLDNWLWLRQLAGELNAEWRWRFDHAKNHKSWDVAVALPIPDIPRKGLTAFTQCMPEHYRVPRRPVTAYRAYYIGDKAYMARWTRRDPPSWWPLDEDA